MRWILLLLAMLGGCGSFGDPSCAERAEQFGAAMASLRAACETSADCVAAGGPVRETCACSPQLPEVAVNKQAYDASSGPQRAIDYGRACASETACDVAPSGAGCVDHVCVLFADTCDSSVDAGP